jgi:RimJ/RimL family protein N-acetyltransferase
MGGSPGTPWPGVRPRALSDGAGPAFATALAAVSQQDELFCQLELSQVDWRAVAARRTAAAAGYPVMRLTGPTPDDLRPAVAAMYEVMNDAPHESPAEEAEVWSAERVPAEDQWRVARRELVYTLLALEPGTGRPAALTRLAVRAGISQAAQMETAFGPGHRGRQLGYLLKASMLEWLADAEPLVCSVGTSNAPGNTRMLAINAALGFTPAERWTFFERAV